MKRLLLTLLAGASLALSAQAALVYSNSFGYADGALDTVSAGSPLGTWFWHSGTTNQMQVLNGQVINNHNNSEDVSAYITNATFATPFSTNALYASFVCNWSTLPTGGSGAYFFHFKDTGTSNFKARVFALTTGAAAGTFRVGISLGGGTTAVIPTDLSLNTDYKLVVRYILGQGSVTNATLWINPNSESSPVNTVTTTDASPTVPIYCVSLREASLSSGAGIFTFDNLLVGTAFGDVATIGGAPTIGGIADQSIPANTNTGPVAFFVSDVETPAASLTLSGTSDNPTLVPNTAANLTFGGSGNNRTVTVTPAAGQQGLAHIQVVVTDGDGLTATNSFSVTVGAPSISAIADQTTPVNTSTPAIAFTVGDNETPNGLTVTASSSNPGVVQDSDVHLSGSGTSRTVRITPQPGQSGLTRITLTVSDGVLTASSSFNLTVYPSLGLVLGDSFNYPDGSVVSGSGSFWVAHSGADSNDAVVVSGKLQVSATNFTDVHALFTNSVYFGADSTSFGAVYGAILYSKFTVNFSQLPSGSGGGYFAHYKDLGTSNFRARIFAETNGAAPGKFRIGIANGGFTVAAFPQDLSLGTAYTVVTRYNVSTASSTLWINPRYESDPGATATDPINPVEIWYYCFRQDNNSQNAGVMLVDDLQIGTAFTDVVPYVAPPTAIPLNLTQVNGNVVLSWSNPLFSLQSAPSASGPYTPVSGATSPYTIAPTGAGLFFRLKY